MKHNRYLPVLALALLTACSKPSPKPVESQAVAAAPQGIVISGSLVDSSGAPIAGAEVTMYEGRKTGNGYQKIYSAKSFVNGKFVNPAASSGADGKFSIEVDPQFYSKDAEYLIEILVKNPGHTSTASILSRGGSVVLFQIGNDRQHLDLGSIAVPK